jgi:hypothetical protein
VSAAGSVGTSKERLVHMAASTTEAITTSDWSDDYDLSFDFDLIIDPVEYARIMRRIGIDGDESAPQASAFNSSI